MSLKKKMRDFLKEFNADNTYSFIFAYEPDCFIIKIPLTITNEGIERFK